MARVISVKAARKNYPDAGIKKGESYYWWKFRFGPKHMSKTYPRPQQLTQSEFLASVYDFDDRIAELPDMEDQEAFESERDSIAEDIRQLGSDQEDKKNNMPDSLQEGATGELLQNRADSCEEWASEVEQIEFEDREGQTPEYSGE